MTPSRRKLDLNVVQSNYHIEITPRSVRRICASCDVLKGELDSDVGMYDRVVIQEILKEIAQTQQVDLAAKQRFKGVSSALPVMVWYLYSDVHRSSCCYQ